MGWNPQEVSEYENYIPHLLSDGYSSFTRRTSLRELMKDRARREAPQMREDGITFGMFRREGLRDSLAYTVICELYDPSSRDHLGLHSSRVVSTSWLF